MLPTGYIHKVEGHFQLLSFKNKRRLHSAGLGSVLLWSDSW